MWDRFIGWTCGSSPPLVSLDGGFSGLVWKFRHYYSAALLYTALPYLRCCFGVVDYVMVRCMGCVVWGRLDGPYLEMNVLVMGPHCSGDVLRSSSLHHPSYHLPSTTIAFMYSLGWWIRSSAVRQTFRHVGPKRLKASASSLVCPSDFRTVLCWSTAVLPSTGRSQACLALLGFKGSGLWTKV